MPYPKLTCEACAQAISPVLVYEVFWKALGNYCSAKLTSQNTQV